MNISIEPNNLKLLVLLSSVIKMVVIDNKRRTKKKKICCRNWQRRREEGRGVSSLLNNELRVEDPSSYKNFLRLTEIQFEFLLNYLDGLKKINTFMREVISVRDKLNVTLRFVATGETYRSLMFTFRVHESTISRFVPEVCEAIVRNLGKLVLKTPNTAEQWKKIAMDFENISQFPHALVAVIAPYVVIADDAFPLSEHLMKPYRHRGLDHDCQIFNYRLSRARRIVENAFGILGNRFRILLNPINLSVKKVELITLTCVILHNYLTTENGKHYTDVTDDTVQNLTTIGQQGGNYSSTDAEKYVTHLKNIFFRLLDK